MPSHLLYDAKHALRGLFRDRGFTAVALLSIGLGVGANTAIYSLVDQALFQPLPVRNPERLVLLDWNGGFVGAGWGTGNLLSHPMFRDLSRENQVFDGLFARHPTRLQLIAGTASEPVYAEIVSGSYFPVLGVRPALGRLLSESDDQTPGAHPVVVVSHDYWKNRLGAASDAVGRKVLVNHHPMTVIGVAPEGFYGMDAGQISSLWVPAMMAGEVGEFNWLQTRRGRWLHVFGRLKPGMTIGTAKSGLATWFKAMLDTDTRREDWPKVTPEQFRRYSASTLDVLPAAEGRSDLSERLKRPLMILLAATGLILLLACFNVANLCLARAFSRRREIALRLALGASRGRIVGELMMQNALLALGGALLGVFLAPLVTGALISYLPEAAGYKPDVDWHVFLLALGVALLTSFAFGLAPALQASRAHPGSALKEESNSVTGGLRLRRILVAAQIALAMILLTSAGLFIRTLENLRARGPGFNTSTLLSFRVESSKSGYDVEQARRFNGALLESLPALPEVESASLSVGDMLTGSGWNMGLTIEAGPRVVSNGPVHLNAVSPQFFATLGTPLLAGRNFDARDRDTNKDPQLRGAIVNESFARRYFGDRSPLGAHLGIGIRPDTPTPIEIIGVVQTFSRRGLREMDDQVFFSFEEGAFRNATFFVRTRTSPESAFASIRATARQVDAAVPVTDLTTLDNHIDRQTLLNERLLASLASAFAVLAVILSVVGLCGVISFVVSRRTREIGIRLALGAPRGAAVGLVLQDAAWMVLAGLCIALPVVWMLGRFVETQLFGVRPMDAVTLAAASTLIALVALGASLVPARRASSITPLEALRYE